MILVKGEVKSTSQYIGVDKQNPVPLSYFDHADSNGESGAQTIISYNTLGYFQ